MCSLPQQVFPPNTPLSVPQAIEILSSHGLPSSPQTISIRHLNRVFNTRNTTYLISTPNGEYVLRFSSPWGTKTEAEVAAIHLASNHDPTLPLPKVVGWCGCDSLAKSPTGVEYILLERLPGIPLGDLWSQLSTQNKKMIAKKLVSLLGQFQSIKCSKIGSFRFKRIEGSGAPEVEVGPLFRTGSGPFSSYPEYLVASINTELSSLQASPFLMEGTEMPFLIERIKKFAKMLSSKETLPQHVTRVPFVFCHMDLHAYNILVEPESLEICGVVDFEFTGSLPIDGDWFKCFSFVGADAPAIQYFGDEWAGGTMEDAHRRMDCPDLKEMKELRVLFLSECRSQGVITPKDIPGHGERALLHYFVKYICPWWIADGSLDVIPDGWRKERETARERIKAVLTMYGI